ncbi:MAG: hypothetical protein HOE83_23365 [Alphaproteobacteria bacterium]|jgi:hypothetical protein|nr:hypothetical protein [Alphaproteobacteria bacterium]
MITFIAANNGRLEMTVDGHRVLFADTPEDVADIIRANADPGQDDVPMSSSMDFASEEGFATDHAARAMFEVGIALV